MPAAPLPHDELQRQRVLHSYQILDTPPDDRIDALVRLASLMHDMPIGAVSLVDADRQWFKSGVGLSQTETPRAASFCAHAILRPGEVMVVEDATLDPRFADNPLVRGAPGIRFDAGAPIVSPEGQPLGALCIIDNRPRRLDSTARQHLADLAAGIASMLDLHRSNQLLARAATHDPLTGLANRMLFEPQLDVAIEAALAGRTCAVLCIDLDRFKTVNDALGHAGGDAVLRQAADRLTECLRPGDLAARLGGDEFSVLMRAPFPPDAPQALAEQIVAALARPYAVDGAEITIGASVGVATAPVDGTDAAGLMHAADRALYGAKRSGRGRALGASVAGTPAGVPEESLDHDLRAAVGESQFTLNWQPYLQVASGRVHGHEALLRWVRPGHGPVPPSQFIPAAEASGLIADLDAWVLGAACRAAAAWDRPDKVSINLSPYWFYLGDLMPLLTATLRASGLPARRLVIEMTERTLIEDPAVARQRIEAINALGASVALDDFGVGYSSLSYLSSFRFGKIKLDRAFVSVLGRDRRSDAVARAILRLGHDLGMQVCAEGVETEAQLDFLRREGCDFVQGYLLGRPSVVPQFGAGSDCAGTFRPAIRQPGPERRPAKPQVADEHGAVV